MKILTILLAAVLSLSANAGDDSEAFKDLLEKEWEFRLSEFPSLARRNGDKSKAHLVGHVSEKDQLRRKASGETD